jgi:serine/threonine protein kinase
VSASTFTLAGRYRLRHVLGEGGMGRVWEAYDTLLDRDVAIKEMHPPSGLRPDEHEQLRRRVLREARAIARIDHPHVVRVLDVLHESGEPWIVMELVPSRSLFEVVRLDGPLSPEQTAKVGVAVLAGLRAAHASGLLHRDVKPANVLLGFDGRIVLTDFGLALAAGDASMTTTGVVLGSPSYLAPERALDLPAGPAADLWSLGATLYAAVEGRPPYSKSSPVAVLAALAGDEPPRPPVRAGALQPVLEALLEKDPARRADAETADRMLRTVAAGGTVPPTTSAADAPPAERGGKRRRRAVLTAVAVAVVLAAGAGFVLQRGNRPAAEASGPVAAGSPSSGAAPSTAAQQPAGPSSAPSHSPTSSSPSASASPGPSPSPSRTAAPPPPNSGPIDPAAWFQLVNHTSAKCVDVRGGSAEDRTPVQQLACGSTGGQQFRLIPTSDGNVRIASRLNSAESLDVTDQSAADFALIQLWPYNGRQQWRAVPEGGGYFHFVNKFSDKCLDVPNASAGDAVQLDQFACNGTPAQSFRLKKV